MSVWLFPQKMGGFRVRLWEFFSEAKPVRWVARGAKNDQSVLMEK